jgi:hypothetical protein
VSSQDRVRYSIRDEGLRVLVYLSAERYCHLATRSLSGLPRFPGPHFVASWNPSPLDGLGDEVRFLRSVYHLPGQLRNIWVSTKRERQHGSRNLSLKINASIVHLQTFLLSCIRRDLAPGSKIRLSIAETFISWQIPFPHCFPNLLQRNHAAR